MALDIATIPEMTGVKPKAVKVRDIVIQDDMQPRLWTSPDAVRRYKETIQLDPRLMPPVLLWGQGKRLVLIDGWHRVQAHQEIGPQYAEYVQAHIIKCDEDRARWLAALANLSHGLPLKRGDHRSVFRRYVNAGANKESDGSLKTYREIRLDLGGLRGVSTLHGWMQQYYPSIAAEMAGREEIEKPTPRKPEETETQRRMKEHAMEFMRISRKALKDSKGGAREDLLSWGLYLIENLGWTLEVEPKDLFEVAKDAQWRQEQAEEEALRHPAESL